MASHGFRDAKRTRAFLACHGPTRLRVALKRYLLRAAGLGLHALVDHLHARRQRQAAFLNADNCVDK
ncbi:hypothetical protein [Cupriavidus basilensis]|uniref:hypothetical protein n=1 Tax=Cupriavidus basilensis TaxID=68895 RepID=UPI0039F6A8FA